jgi:hypothetical protein
MHNRRRQPPAYLLALTLAAFGACGDDAASEAGADSGTGEPGGSGGSSAAGTGGRGGSGGRGSVYALANTVATQDSATTYVHVVSSLDIKEKVGTRDAREYGKYATIAAQGGDLLIASDEEPVVQRFSVGSDLELTETAKLGFSEAGLSSAAFYRSVFISDEKAYFNVGEVERVLWTSSLRPSAVCRSSRGVTTRRFAHRRSAEVLGGLLLVTIDDRTLVLLPSADLTATSVYEVKPEGDAEKLFETTGWTYQLIKVR